MKLSLLAHLPDSVLVRAEQLCAFLAPVLTSRLRLRLWLEVYARDTRRSFVHADRHGWPRWAGV